MGTKLDKLMVDLQMELSLESCGLNFKEYEAVHKYMQRYATECVKASLEKVCENVYCHCCQGDYKGIDYEEVTSPDNIVLL